jgi:HSPB1-associated protein 1
MDGLSKIPPSLSCNELPAPNELNKLILHELKTPFIFKNILQGRWIGPLNWNPQAISHILNNVTTKFKVCPKYTSKEYKDLLSITDVVYETHCQYIEATFGEFNEWLLLSDDDETDSRPKRRAGGLSQVCRDTHWVYADYKYMKELCKDYPDVIRAIDWGVFGFESRNGNESTLWVGTEGACTPCHYDTYGCNLVAQLWGTKEWTLYPPTDDLYPTRIPYEESSVFSSVNLKSPQVEKYPNFSKATPYKVTLFPGDVLFVPYHWWHYVECIDPAVSVNTWIELVILIIIIQM